VSQSTPSHVGPYRVVRVLGQGGMGVVYEVSHPGQPDKRLALKLILGENPSRDVLARFQREAQLLAKVSHPNIVGVLDFAVDENSRPYMVFDYVAGQDLRSLCYATPMDPEQAARIGASLASALDLLHRKGIIHRDLKPENVILRPDGTPVLLDFGLARELDAERLTVTGTILGTPAYMSPEQAEGFKDIDPRTDVYGLGGILYYLLLGRPPFRGKAPMAVLRQVLMDEPSWGEDKDTVITAREPLPQIQNSEPTWDPSAGSLSGTGGAEAATVALPGGGLPSGLAGAYPHQAADQAAKVQATSCLVPSQTKVPRPLEAIVRVAMAKERADRHVSAASLRDDLENYLGGGVGAAGGRLRLQGWRRRRKLWILALILALLGLAIAETWRRSSKDTPLSSPSATATPRATPTPSETPAAKGVMVRAIATLPPLGSRRFPEELTRLRKSVRDDGALGALARARTDLDALRDLEGSERAAAVEGWRKDHGLLPPELLGPIQLELGPRWRWNHVAGGRRDTKRYVESRDPEDHSERREYLGEYGARVCFLDAAGTQALVANGRRVVNWDLSGSEPRAKGKRDLEAERGARFRWKYTFSAVHYAPSGLTYLGGTTRHGKKAKWPGLLVMERASITDTVGLPSGTILNRKSDRLISITISPQGRWLAGGTDQGEVLVVPLQRTYGHAMTEAETYQLGNHLETTDVQAVVFLDEERLLSLGGDKSEPDLSLRMWRVARGGQPLAPYQGAVYRFKSVHNSEPPSLVVRLSPEEVLVGRGERGRVLHFKVQGTSIQLLGEIKDGAGPALRRSPTAGVAASAPWGRTVYLGSGLFPDERSFPRDPVPGALSAWVGQEFEPTARFAFSARAEGVCSLDVSRDGKRLIVGTQLGEVLVFDLLGRRQ